MRLRLPESQTPPEPKASSPLETSSEETTEELVFEEELDEDGDALEDELIEAPAPRDTLPELSPTDLDTLMGKDPTSLSKQDIAQIVRYHRRQAARRAAGEKPEKVSTGPKVDLAGLLAKLVNKPAGVPEKRRG